MLRFRLGPIPVEVHPIHLLLAAALGVNALDAAAGEPAHWPGRLLANDSGGSPLATRAAVVGLWVAIVFISALVHELGHALAWLAFQYRPSIALVAFGGLTQSNAQGPQPWHRTVLVTAAGPLLGASLGKLCSLVSASLGPGSEVAAYALDNAAAANYFWAVLNLLPVLPLDGGHISAALLTRGFGRSGSAAAQVLAIGVSAAVMFVGWRLRAPVLLILFSFFGLLAVRTLMGLVRGEGLAVPSQELQQTEALFRAGELPRAREAAEQVLAGDPAPAVRSRAHQLLGWIALKQGEGRRALDHFSQVQGRGVEKHALAAAFSLVGDDARALPLWQQAYEASRDPTILHEWAGALLRAGETDRAAGLPGVDLGKAYACAERVAFLRGNFSRAAELGLAALDRHPSAAAAYDVACALARAGELDRAVLVLERARDLGFSDVAYARTDADLGALHGHPGFERWLEALGKSASA